MMLTKLKIPEISKDELGLFQKLLIKESGLYFNNNSSRDYSLSLALSERFTKMGVSSYREYYDFITSHPEGGAELKSLLNLVTVGETYFFRYPIQFEVLRENILPEIIKKKMSDIRYQGSVEYPSSEYPSSIYNLKPILRIWSAGCSTGDEAYSIAITLLETLPNIVDWEVSILATDVNMKALDKAKEGIYDPRGVRDIPQRYLQKYFIKNGTRFQLKDKIKNMVRFIYHNLAKDPFNLEEIRDADIIFCRNVTIYFDLDTTRRVIDGFYRSLTNGGYLFIGSAETLWQIPNKFKILEFPHVFIYKKEFVSVEVEVEVEIKPFINIPELSLEEIEGGFSEEKSSLLSDAMDEGKKEVIPEVENVPVEYRKERVWESLYQEGLRHFRVKDYDRALTIFDQISNHNPNFIHAYFGKATILANQARYEEAIKELEKIRKLDNLFIDAYYLLGVLYYKINELENAELEFRKVIYVDHKIALAYFNLGNIYQYQKKIYKAKREYKNALKILEQRPRDEVVNYSEDLTTELLTHVCKKILKGLDKWQRS